MTKIRSVAQAIGIIGREVEKMGDKEAKAVPRKYCIECNADVTHPGAYFCKPCAISFYNDGHKEEESE